MNLAFRRDPQPPVPPDPGLLLRYLTVGGAEVELRRHDFTMHRYCWCERKYEREHAGPGKEHVRETEHGYQVRCRGCGELVPKTGTYHDRTDFTATEYRDARQAANEHAASCRAMPGLAG